MKKVKVIAAILCISVVAWNCSDGTRDGATVDNGSVSGQTYSELSYEERQAKLEQCAKCHQQEYQNEMIGPHAHSYASLLEHRAMADTSRYFPKPYHQFVENAFEVACVKCHVPKNLFETIYLGMDTAQNMKHMTGDDLSSLWKASVARKDATRMTGIDCLTCHLRGDRVITTGDFERTPEVDAPCNPLASSFFSSNTNCAGCHPVTNASMQDNPHVAGLNGTMPCNGCHMEKDEKGEPTHYYFWRHDAPDKGKNPMLESVFGDIRVELIASNMVILSWINRSTPHQFSECAELIAEIKFYDHNGINCAQTNRRLNNKLQHDHELVDCFGDEPVWGEIGMTYLPDGSNHVDTIRLDCSDITKVEIIGYDKPQYWISDSLAHKVYTRRIML